MDKQQIKQSLDHLAAQGIRQDQDLWPRIRARTQPHSIGASWGRLTPTARLGWSALILVVMLSAGMTVYAASPVIGRLFIMDEQLKNQDYSKLGQHFEISQTQGDVTVTLQWAFADANRVLVGYAIQTAGGRRFDTSSALSDDHGTVYLSNGGYGVTGQSEVLNVSLPPGEGATLASFTLCPTVDKMNVGSNSASCAKIGADAVKSPSGQPTLNLHFSVQANYYIYPTAEPTTQPPSSDASGQPQNMTAQGQPVTLGESIGPFTFDFSLPVEAALK